MRNRNPVDSARDGSPTNFWDGGSGAPAALALPKARNNSWHWAVGGFLFFIGGAMLVAPHDYAIVWQVVPLPYPAWWGSLYLLAGIAVLAVPTMVPEGWFSVAAYLAAAVLMSALAGVYASVGRLVGVAGHLPLAAGCILVLFLTVRRRRFGATAEAETVEVEANLVRSALGLCGALAGLILLVAPAHSVDPAFDPLRPFLPWSGLLLLVAGSALAALPFLPLPPTGRGPALKIASIASAAICLGYVFIAVRYAGNWPGIAYFGWLGLILGAQPILEARAHNLPAPGSLRIRLTFLMAAAAVIPLIVVAALSSNQMEQAARAKELERQQTQAVALAEAVASYINLHRAALIALANQPGLAEMPLEGQRRELQIYQQAFPDALSFALYRADGSLITRIDNVSIPPSIAGHPNFEIPRATGKPSIDIGVSPALERPVFDYSAPVVNAQGRFAGVATSALDSTRVVEFLARQSHGQADAYLVDEVGRAIAHPDSAHVAALADLSSTPPVAAALAGQTADGSLTYSSEDGEQLAAYANVPGQGWNVVVEESSVVTLGAVQAGRQAAYGIFLLSLLATALLGWWVAGRLAAPLADLAAASAALASGDSTAPLPMTGIAEANYLARTFGAMRTALVEHSARLQESKLELRETADQLMAANMALQQSHLELQALTRRLLEVQEEERRTLSRDLHDTAAQSMTALRIGLTLLERETDPSPEQVERIETLRQTAEEVMEDLHRLAVNLRPSSLDRLGLIPALEQLIDTFQKQSGAQVSLSAYNMEGERLRGELEIALYRIVQESLTNIGRHAHASQVSILVQKMEGHVNVIVEDNGLGFDVEEALQCGRLGLHGMRERAEILGGTLTIESQIGSGSVVIVDLPATE